jgi:hypothetical protein
MSCWTRTVIAARPSSCYWAAIPHISKVEIEYKLTQLRALSSVGQRQWGGQWQNSRWKKRLPFQYLTFTIRTTQQPATTSRKNVFYHSRWSRNFSTQEVQALFEVGQRDERIRLLWCNNIMLILSLHPNFKKEKREKPKSKRAHTFCSSLSLSYLPNRPYSVSVCVVVPLIWITILKLWEHARVPGSVVCQWWTSEMFSSWNDKKKKRGER